MTPTSRSLFSWVPLLVLFAAGSLAQSTGDFDAQLHLGDSALQAGLDDAALSAGDAAVRIAPQRWDGYALSGRALLALKRYEAAADAFSQAIDRAPAGEQPSLRELRRECLLQESGVSPSVPVGPPPRGAGAPAAAPAPPPSSPSAAPAQVPTVAVPGAPAPAAPVARRRRRSKGGPVQLFSPDSPEAAWTDSAGLVWARPWYFPAKDVGPFDYAQAQAVCSDLQLLGLRNWRLPTVQEVQRIYQVSSKAFRFSAPKFDPDYGLDDAIKHDAWQLRDFTVNGDTFTANRLLIWSSTPGDQPGRHEGVYFGRAYSVDDNQKMGSSLHGTRRRVPFHAYALCVNDDQAEASR